MDNIEIVSLVPEEWQQYRDLRLRALKEEPQAFGSTYEDNASHPKEYWRKRIDDTINKKTQWLVFARLNHVLVGMVGAFIEKDPEDVHIIAVYVTPEARGKGISKLLMKELLTKIKTNEKVKKIIVDVNSEQGAAFNLYKNSGFQIIKKYKMPLGDGKEHEICQLQMLTSNVL